MTQKHSGRMRRLAASDLLPERAGQPVKVWAHISLADLLRLDGSSALQEEWTAQVRAQWAGHRARASQGGGGDGASMTTIGRDPAYGEEQQLRHCCGDEHQCETRRRFGTWRKDQHGEAQRYGRREIAQYGHGTGEDQNALRARHRPIVSF